MPEEPSFGVARRVSTTTTSICSWCSGLKFFMPLWHSKALPWCWQYMPNPNHRHRLDSASWINLDLYQLPSWHRSKFTLYRPLSQGGWNSPVGCSRGPSSATRGVRIVLLNVSLEYQLLPLIHTSQLRMGVGFSNPTVGMSKEAMQSLEKSCLTSSTQAAYSFCKPIFTCLW